jgi:hypothetical protein
MGALRRRLGIDVWDVVCGILHCCHSQCWLHYMKRFGSELRQIRYTPIGCNT